MRNKICMMLFSLLFVFGFVIAVSAADASLDGGPARLAAMGGQEIAVEDNATIIDLNNLGFSAAIFTRPAQSVIYLYPELDLITEKTVDAGTGETDTTTYYGGGTGASTAVNNGLLFFFSKDTALTIKPMLSIMPGSEKYSISGDSYSYLYYIPAGELSIAQRLGNNFSVALTGGYMRQVSYEKESDGTQYNDYFEKIEYDLSFAMLPSAAGDWTFALSGGNKTGSFLTPPMEIDLGTMMGEMEFMNAPIYIFNLHEYYKYTSGWEYYYDYNINGFNVSLGAASGRSGDMQVDLKAGLLAGVSEEEKYKELYNGSTMYEGTNKILSNGIGTNSELDFRMKLGGMDVGLKGMFGYVGGDTPGGKENFLNGRGVAGVNFGSKGFIVPLEFYYEAMQEAYKGGTDEDKYGFYDFGARIGNEIGLSDTISLRYGLDYTLAAEYYQYKSGGVVTYESKPAGSTNNPWFMQIGYNAGIGFKSQANEFNIGLRIEPQWENPKYTDYKEYDRYNFKITSDLKFFL
jgi:hypothetical protein